MCSDLLLTKGDEKRLGTRAGRHMNVRRWIVELVCSPKMIV